MPLKIFGWGAHKRSFVMLVGSAFMAALGSMQSAAQMPPMPAAEANFIAAVVGARSDYKSAPNEMAAGAVRASRRENVCAAVKSAQVRDWIGTVVTLSSSDDGKGVLKVALAQDISVTTGAFYYSYSGNRTLIEPGSSVFNDAVKLQRGDKVAFSGVFFSSKVDCWDEKGSSLRESMTSPTYTFRFSAIRKL